MPIVLRPPNSTKPTGETRGFGKNWSLDPQASNKAMLLYKLGTQQNDSVFCSLMTGHVSAPHKKERTFRYDACD